MKSKFRAGPPLQPNTAGNPRADARQKTLAAARRVRESAPLLESSRMVIDTFTGGMFETNCFFLPDSAILIDAPQESAEWLRRTGKRVALLLLTHGHIDHVYDAAAIQREHGCAIAYHAETLPMVTDRDFFRRFGFGLEVEPITVDSTNLTLAETASQNLGGIDFALFDVPGHCPGSLCFLAKNERVLFGGDVLFANGVGRWDLPGGDRDVLLTGIKKKLLPLGDNIRVLPGHGPATTIGRERKTNPYLV